MAKFETIGTASIPGKGSELRLLQRNDEFSIRIAGAPGELMNTRLHGSEDALAELACRRVADRPQARVLVGGLGMGFTLAAALKVLGAEAEVVVAELVPGVVEWNRGPLGNAAGNPLADPRTRVSIGDVGELLRREPGGFDAIMLDVDNGPEGLTRRENDWLYSPEGLATAQQALRPDGVLAVWSAGQDPAFTERLRRVGLLVETVTVRAQRPGKGARHCIWLAY
ncbi:MAG: spermidine synthase [Pseudomonadota bacterium]